MSESNNENNGTPSWRSQLLDDVYPSGSSSGEVFQPGLRRRYTTLRISPTQTPTNSDHDYVIEPQSAVQVENRSVDVMTIDELEEEGEEEEDEEASDYNDDADNSDSSLSTEAPVRNSDHALAEPMITMPIDDATTPSPPSKKRKRTSNIDGSDGAQVGTPTVDSRKGSDDEDDGLTCPICLDTWEMSGAHRLVSLRCGHLFGESCIRRWVIEKSVCPQCKAKVTPWSYVHLYAKRVRAVDRTEEHNLRIALKKENERYSSLQTDLVTIKLSHALLLIKKQELDIENQHLRETLSSAVSNSVPKKLPSYRLYMEQNFEMAKEPGCRVMVYSPQKSSLIASQKSTMNMFPGYGVRFIDVPTFKPVNFLYTSNRTVRDICLSDSQQEIVVTCLEPRCKLFDLRTRQVSASFVTDDKPIWSCAMDRNQRENYLYLGDHQGNVYMYDIRNPVDLFNEFPSTGELSPAIRVVPVQSNKTFPDGGFLVCKGESLWFYEYVDDNAVPTRLSVQGPFMSLDYDAAHESLLISTRINQNRSQTCFILGKLEKMNEVILFVRKNTFFGSKTSIIMTRANQIAAESNTLVVGYIHDNNQLAVYDAQREDCVQTLPGNEIVYDVCPIYLPGSISLAALTSSRCRLYNVYSSAVTYT